MNKGIDLKEVQEKHILFLRGDKDGVKANLRWADLSRADLSEADLSEATGNNKEVVIIQTGIYTIVWTKLKIWIGCKSFTLNEWKSFKEKDVRGFDEKAVEFYQEWRDILLQMFEKFEKQLN